MKTLIVVDMQNDFIDGALANPAAQAIVEPMVEYIKNFEGNIIFTRDTHYENYLDTQEGRKLPVEHCLVGTKGWRPHIDLVEAAHQKQSYWVDWIDKDSFGDIRELAAVIDIRDCAEDEIYLCGTCTDICVVSIALNLKARYPETKIYCLGNLCAGVTPESHEAALTVMKMCQIEVV